MYNEKQISIAVSTIMESLNVLLEKFGRTYQAGDVLFYEGQPGDEIYFMIKGRVRVTISYYIDTPDSLRRPEEGPSKELCILQAGDVFGELALLDNLPRSATITALDDVQVIVFNSDNLYANIGIYPDLAVRLLKILANRMRRMDSDLKELLGYKDYLKHLKKSVPNHSENS